MGGGGGDATGPVTAADGTIKAAVPEPPLAIEYATPAASQPGALKLLPLQPSPYESAMSRVHEAFGGSICAASYGAPPVMGAHVPEQVSVHDTSLGSLPPVTPMADATVAAC